MMFVGEIYNRDQLAKELGIESNCDAEVVQGAYLRWKEASFSRLRGAFAFQIADGDKTLLVRDQFGVVPYYYYMGKLNGSTTKTIVAADSVSALLEKGVPRRLSKNGLATCLAYGSVQHPWTMIENVLCVPPASYVVYNHTTDELNVEVYWKPKFEIAKWRFEDAVAALSGAIEKSVSSMVDYGGDPSAFLSGGLDSSTIAIMMRRINPDRVARTYCIYGEDTSKDERYWANLVASRNHTKHTDILLSDEEVRTSLLNAINDYDQPSLDGINFWFGAKLMKERGEKVVFSGEGGDELFQMYGQMRKPLMANKYDKYFRWMPRSLGRIVERHAPQEKFRKLGQLMGRNVPPFYIAWRILSEERITRLLNKDLVEFTGLRNPVDDSYGIPMDVHNYVSWMDMRNIVVDTYLRDGYQTAAPHGIIVRTPLLDVDVAEIIYSMEGRSKYNLITPKPHLAAVCGKYLPDECRTRKKMGFSLPFDRYFNGTVKDLIQDFLAGTDSNIFDGQTLREMGRQYYSGRIYWSNIWVPLMIDLWAKRNRVEI